jgi:hypothetical protein
MAYRCGDRYQMRLMPQSIEDYVGFGNPVWAYDAFVEAINFRELRTKGSSLLLAHVRIRETGFTLKGTTPALA